MPVYQTADAAGMDLQAWPDGPVEILPGARALLPTGIAVAIPRGYEGQIRPRSGWALRYGITLLNSPGTVDSDYRGEVMVLLINLGQEGVIVSPGDRIAQMVLAPVSRGMMEEVTVLDDTARGAGGYGHTGGQP